MTIQHFSDYQAPPQEPHRQDVASIESDRGTIVLRPNRFGLGYRLHEDSEGFGPGDVENETTPRLGDRGAVLGEQRELEGDMQLSVIISSTSNTEVKRLAARLTSVLKPADGVVRLALTDPATDEGRYREVAYKSGLKVPVWTSPTIVQYNILVDYLDPWAYSTQDNQVTLGVTRGATGGLRVPVRFPVRFARSGGATDRRRANDGDKPSPITLQFNGPVSDPVASLIGLWEFRVNGSLEYDEYLIIDPKAGTAAVHSTTHAGVRSAFTMIGTGSRFSDLIMPPGQHAFSFRAIDPTYTGSMTASWPHTYQSMH